MKKRKDNQNSEKFNWKLVLISFVIIALAYVVISEVRTKLNQPPRITAYCWFNTTINDDVPRDQCGILKIISRDLTGIKIHEFEKFGKCSESLDKIPKCEGETYHFTKYRLKDLCEGKNCDTDGVICSAYFITYYDKNDPDRAKLEKNYFSKANIESEKILMEEFDRCNAKNKWIPWR